VFHSPGLHIFPGQKEVYPAEYHVHFSTGQDVEPKRAVTLVIPVSHHVDGPEKPYFAAMKAKPDPTVVRPTLESLLAKLGGSVLQYQGPDIRGRVRSSSEQKKEKERQFLLVLKVASIRASDLERIPSLDGKYSDPRDLPAPGVEPKVKAISRDRIARTTVLATPGLLYDKTATVAATAKESLEMKIKPIKVIDGRIVVDDKEGKPVDIKKLLGLSGDEDEQGTGKGSRDPTSIILLLVNIFAIFIGFYFGLLISDMCWRWFFKGALVNQWEPLKIWFLPTLFGIAV
jgi:hypothetical protein